MFSGIEIKIMSAKTKKIGSAAPGNYLGYATQVWRLLHRLFVSKAGEVIAFELLDDVSSHSSEGQLLEQVKSSISGINQVANGASDLWKTLGNWALLIKNGKIDPKVTRFVLYTRQKGSGEIVERLSSVASMADAVVEFRNCLELIKEDGVYLKGIADYVMEVESLDEKLLAELVFNFYYEWGSGNVIDDVRRDYREALAAPSQYEDRAINALLGWAKAKIDGAIQSLSPPIITHEMFKSEFQALMQMLDRSSYLACLADDVNASSLGDYEDAVFVRQLRIIDIDNPDIEKAAIAKLRAESTVTKWAENGLVHETSLLGFRTDMVGFWKAQGYEVDVLADGKGDAVKGRLLYGRCICRQARIEGKDTYSEFVLGAFQSLADSLDVGWHPNFKDVLAKNK